MLKHHLTAGALSVLAKRVLAISAAPLLACASASAATYTWDPLATGTGSDGPGSWDTSSAIWSLSGADTTWPVASTDTASFGSGGTIGSVTVAGGGVSAGGITFNANYDISGGSIALAAASTITVNATGTIDSVLTGAGSSLTIGGPNELILTGANTYTGGTTISNGIVQLATGATLGTGPIVNNGSLSVNVGAGTETVANAISGSGGINKVGSGKLILTGTSTYNGTTLVPQGTLQLDGSVTASSPIASQSNITLLAGTSLTGTGSYSGGSSGAVSYVAGSFISPGDNPGDFATLSFNSISMVSSATPSFLFNLSGTSNASDTIALSGAFTRGSGTNPTTGTYAFDLGGTALFGATYTLFTYASTNNNIFKSLVATDLPAGDIVLWNLGATSLSVTVVPEPSQYGIAFGALALFAILMRRKRGSMVEIMKGFMNKQTVRNAAQVLLVIASLAFAAQPAGAKLVTFQLQTATFDQLQAAMNSGALTSTELATLFLNRRATYDQSGLFLNAVVSISPTLMADCAAQDSARAHGTRGPLLGLLFCTKDSYPTINMVQSGGVKSWLSSTTGIAVAAPPVTTPPTPPLTGGTDETGIAYTANIPSYDCYIVGELKAAGAIQLGHGNMDTWATSAGSTNSNAYGVTSNAYVLGSASGSSGGPGCMTGSDFSNFAWGGETGGSIRGPSDRAGITGFKVGVGTESINGIIPLSADHDVVGPMARYVQDEAYIMDATAVNQDPNDPWYGHNYFNSPNPSGYHTAAVATTSLSGVTIGLIGTYDDLAVPVPAPTPVQLPGLVNYPAGVAVGMTKFPTTHSTNTTGTQTTDPAIKAIFARTQTELQSLGATVITVFLPPNLDTSIQPPAYDDDNTASFPKGSPLTTPGLVSDPSPLRTAMTGSAASNQILAWMNDGYLIPNNQGIYTRLTQANAASSSLSTTVRNLAWEKQLTTYNDTGTGSATSSPLTSAGNALNVQPFFACQQIYQSILKAWMASYNINAFAFPVSYSKSRSSNSEAGRDTINNQGNPLLTVPIGIIPTTGEPITMGLLGSYHDEVTLMKIAYAYQHTYNYRVPSTLTPPLSGETITYDDSAVVSAAFASRADKLGPVVAIKKKATVDGSSVLIEGIADDASGIGTLKVFVNGKKIAVKAGKKWTAKVSLADFKKLAKTGKSVDVEVLAKDSVGNSSATLKSVKI